MKYMLLIIDTEAGLATPPAELAEVFAQIRTWYDQMTTAGVIADAGHELQGGASAKTIRATGVTDGPYIEAKEFVSSFFLLDVDSEQRALDIAAEYPFAAHNAVEVWPILHESGEAI